MNIQRIAVAAAATAAGTVLPDVSQAADWDIDTAHSAAQFSVRHMMVANVRGHLAGVTGVVHLDEADPARSSVEARIDAATINTREPKRDAHLKSPDFFDVAKHPFITFKSTKVDKTKDGRLKVTGDLTMHGVTRPAILDVTLVPGEFKDPYGNLKRGASATTKVNRKDFGLRWNVALEAGGVMVGDEITIDLDVELQRKTVPKA